MTIDRSPFPKLKRMNQFFASKSTIDHFRKAVRECLDDLSQNIDQPNLLLIFFAGHDDDGALAEGLTEAVLAYPEAQISGCNSAATICNSEELEGTQSVVIWAARFENCQPEVVHLQYQRTREGAAFAGFPNQLDRTSTSETGPKRTLIAFADPFTFPMDLFLDRINEEHAGMHVVGGMASAASSPGDSRLIVNRQIVNHGGSFVILATRSPVATVVSQGCRPIGDPMVVTKAERNQIFELGGRPAVDRFLEVYRQLPTSEQRVLQSGLHMGIAISEYREKFGYGDFLIRNVLQMDQNDGSITVADFVKIGQTVQFHLRDQASADLDLRTLLKTSQSELTPHSAAGGLIFSCNGRGLNMFETPHHDAEAIQKILGSIPVAGFFAAGEIGAVSQKNFIHGFTASIVWFGE
jgi:small ligand-binding sensory domain FIST